MKDKLVEELIGKEFDRQQNTIELIASENIVSTDVLEAMGSVLTNKYAEGKPFKRYYNGCHVIDEVEQLACDRFRELFNTDYHVNVQPHSGAQANMAVFEALLDYGDTVLSMDLSNGGHLSHGSPVNYSGKHFNVVQYGINENGEIGYDEVERLALEHSPKLIICGASNYSKIIDFKRFAEIRDKVMEHKSLADVINEIAEDKNPNCYLLADIAHIAGLVAGGVHPSPFGYADIVTTTTHKSLRGPRGGVIACREELAKKIDSAVFPGIQGGPLEHIIAAKAVCFYEALQPEFKEYAEQIIKNANVLCGVLNYRGFKTVGGMTENHLMTVDLRKSYMCEELTGKDAANLLDKYGITVNKNTVPDDPRGPFVTSGLRIGVPAVTTRGFKEDDMKEVGNIIADILQYHDEKFDDIKEMARERALELCKKYPMYK
jgi:glycine hydroxymethyltransferase